MSAASIVEVVLIGFGVAVELACCVGVLVMEDAYDKLHYLGPAAIVGPFAIAVAVVVREALSQAGIKALLTAALLMVASLFGILLAILFFVLQAPDVALSEIVVGAVALPLMILLSLAKIRGGSR